MARGKHGRTGVLLPSCSATTRHLCSKLNRFLHEKPLLDFAEEVHWIRDAGPSAAYIKMSKRYLVIAGTLMLLCLREPIGKIFHPLPQEFAPFGEPNCQLPE